MYKYILFFSLTFLFGQYDYSLEDLNPSSDYFQESIGTSFFPNQITLHYFGSYNWGTCTARFGQLNDLYQDLINDGYYDEVKLVGIGKSQFGNYLNNWTNGNDASVCLDESFDPTWVNWGAIQRDLFVLDHEGYVVFHENITGGVPDNLESLIINLINQISECEDGEINNENPCNPMECINGEWLEIVIDCAEQIGIPCDGGVYIDPPVDECCSTCVQYGDTNFDGALNVLDVVTMVSIVFQGNYDPVSDMNYDGSINVLDVVTLVDIILN